MGLLRLLIGVDAEDETQIIESYPEDRVPALKRWIVPAPDDPDLEGTYFLHSKVLEQVGRELGVELDETYQYRLVTREWDVVRELMAVDDAESVVVERHVYPEEKVAQLKPLFDLGRMDPEMIAVYVVTPELRDRVAGILGVELDPRYTYILDTGVEPDAGEAGG